MHTCEQPIATQELESHASNYQHNDAKFWKLSCLPTILKVAIGLIRYAEQSPHLPKLSVQVIDAKVIVHRTTLTIIQNHNMNLIDHNTSPQKTLTSLTS